MSVIVREPNNGPITLYCKGADSAIVDVLSDTFKVIPLWRFLAYEAFLIFNTWEKFHTTVSLSQRHV